MTSLPAFSPSSPKVAVNLLRQNTTGDQHLLSLLAARSFHASILRHPDSATCHSLTSLLSLYGKYGYLSSARHVFDVMPERDVVSWTAILMAYASCSGQTEETMRLFHEMVCSGTSPNPHTITVVLRRAGTNQGKQLHGYVLKNGWDYDEFIGSSFVEFYAKTQNLRETQLVFDHIKNKDLVCFNTLLSSYGRFGSPDGLVSSFSRMGSTDLVPNESTFVALLNGCAQSGLLRLSKQFHAQSIVRGFRSSEVIEGIAVDMYSKCGDLEAALKSFDRMSCRKNVVAWNSMIGGYGKHGRVGEALQLFDSMEVASVKPDHITFTLLLSACSHSGLVDEGLRLFDSMVEVYKIPARNEHYCCIVDLLGRVGMVREAYVFMKRSGYEFGASVWTALLTSCKFSADVEIAELAARRLFEIEPDSSGSYVALSASFAKRGHWKEAIEVRQLMEGNGVRKDAGCSWIELGGSMHKFKAGEGVGCSGIMDVHSVCDSLNSSIRDSPQVEDLGAQEDYLPEW